MFNLGNLLISTSISIAVAVAFYGASYAQTPDGQTPANEGVCDVLQQDGTTKGLYGLCVAFCEAHDAADTLEPLSEEDFKALEASAPSGKILEKYNAKKSDSDPDMPCVLVEEPCPCWTEAELRDIDGFTDAGSQTTRFICSSNEWSYGIFDQIHEYTSTPPYLFERASASDYFNEDGIDNAYCGYHKKTGPFFEDRLVRSGSTLQGTMTRSQFNSCQLMLREYIQDPATSCELNP